MLLSDIKRLSLLILVVVYLAAEFQNSCGPQFYESFKFPSKGESIKNVGKEGGRGF